MCPIPNPIYKNALLNIKYNWKSDIPHLEDKDIILGHMLLSNVYSVYQLLQNELMMNFLWWGWFLHIVAAQNTCAFIMIKPIHNIIIDGASNYWLPSWILAAILDYLEEKILYGSDMICCAIPRFICLWCPGIQRIH